MTVPLFLSLIASAAPIMTVRRTQLPCPLAHCIDLRTLSYQTVLPM